MKAIIYDSYGPASVMSLRDVPQPNPDANHVLVRVKAAGINPVDWMLREGLMQMMTGDEFPRGMGCDVAGVVEETGPEVSSLHVGDEVFGWIPFKDANSFAELALVPSDTLITKPSQLSFEDAASMPMAAVTAHQALVDTAHLASGEKVLINGCTGGVGLFALQVAKAQGAIVAGTCSKRGSQLAKEHGSDIVFDYHTTNVLDNDERYDVILDASGKLPYEAAEAILTPKGRYLDLLPSPDKMQKFAASDRYIAVMTTVKNEDLQKLAELVEKGALRSHVGRRVALSEAVEGLATMQREGGILGKAVVTV